MLGVLSAARGRATRPAGSGPPTSASTTPTATASSTSTEVHRRRRALTFLRPRAAHQGSLAQQQPHALQRTGSASAPSSTTAAATSWTTRSSSSAASSVQLPRAWSTGPPRSRSRRWPRRRFSGRPNRWSSTSPAGSSSCASCRSPSTRPTAGPGAFRASRAEPHAGRPEPVDHHRLQRRRSRGERVRAGQLRAPATSSRSRRCATGPRASTSASETGTPCHDRP